MAPKKSARSTLKVVFDTSALFTDNEYFLLNKGVGDLIRVNSHHLDITLTWHLPDIVRMERQYQMERRALELLPAVEKVERLLGVNLNIKGDIMRLRVGEAIQNQIDELQLDILMLDHGAVSWRELIECATFRRPPFSATTATEKGFRDALVLESFMQLVEASPKSRSVCRIAFVAGDKLLRDAAEARVKGRTNTRILATIEDLRNLINTLVSEIGEDTVTALREVAEKLFYDDEKHSGFCVTSGTLDRVRALLDSARTQVPQGALGVENVKLGLFRPSFQKKEGSIITWSSRFENEIEAYSYRTPTTAVAATSGTGNMAVSTTTPYQSFVMGTNPTPYGLTTAHNSLLGGSLGLLSTNLYQPSPPPPEKIRLKSGKAIVEVIWTTKVTHRRQLREASIQDLKPVETKWN